MNPNDESTEWRDMELDIAGCNRLTELGNQAIQLGLILGHGFRGGQYEILRRSEVVLLPPNKAQDYLEHLIDQASAD